MDGMSWVNGNPAPIPDNEELRLAALRRYERFLPRYNKDESFDRLVKLAAQLTDVPIAFINLIDDKMQFSKACFGRENDPQKREMTFCQFTILQEDILEIHDARYHPQFAHSPFVTGEFNLQYYCGAPLITPEGFKIGSLCLIDHKPRALTPSQREALKTLAKEVIGQYELELVRAELERLNQEKDEMMQIVSHDMRNPLMGIIGVAEILREEANDADIREMMDILYQSGRGLLGIVNTLLNSSYIKNDGFKLVLQKTDVAEVTRKVLEIHQPAIKLKNIDLVCDIQEGLNAEIDPEKWKQILGNLVGNAKKYTDEGGKITVQAWKNKKRNKLELKVSDTGMGIQLEKLDRIFSGDKRMQRKGTIGETGFSMGLPMVKRFVELHNGTICVESEQGNGTTFYVELPA